MRCSAVAPPRPLNAASIYPPLAFRSLPETDVGNHRFRFQTPLQTAGPREAGSPRLFSPSTHAGLGSPSAPGLPRRRRSTSRVLYPLSGSLLPRPLSHISGPSVHGVHLFRVLLPSRSSASLETALLSCPFTTSVSIVRPLWSGLQSFDPLEEPHSLARFYTGFGAVTLLRFSSLRHPPVPGRPFERPPSFALSTHFPNK